MSPFAVAAAYAKAKAKYEKTGDIDVLMEIEELKSSYPNILQIN